MRKLGIVGENKNKTCYNYTLSIFYCEKIALHNKIVHSVQTTHPPVKLKSSSHSK